MSDVERVEQYRARMWRGMVWNRWLHRLALTTVTVALVLALLARSAWLGVFDAFVLLSLLITHRMYVDRMAEHDRYWQESLDHWRGREP